MCFFIFYYHIIYVLEFLNNVATLILLSFVFEFVCEPCCCNYVQFLLRFDIVSFFVSDILESGISSGFPPKSDLLLFVLFIS